MRVKVTAMLFILTVFSITVQAQDIKRLIKDHLYSKAIDYYNGKLNGSLNTDEKKDVYRNLMQLYSQNSALLKVFLRSALDVQLKYYELKYEHMVKEKLTADISLLLLMKGICYFEKGDYRKASEDLKKFLVAGSDNKDYSAIGKIWYGGSLYAAGDRGKASEIWNGVNPSSALLKSELAYMFSRTGYDRQKMVALIKQCFGEIQNPRVLRNVLNVSLLTQDYSRILELVNGIDFEYTPFVRNKGQVCEMTYYDPSILFTAALGNSYASYFYANMLNTVCQPEEQSKYNTAYYRAQYFFESYQSSEAVKCLDGSGDYFSKLLLGRILYQRKEIKRAFEIFAQLEGTKEQLQKSELGYLYYSAGINDKAETARKLMTEAVAAGTSNKAAYQQSCRNLAKYLAENGQMDAAAKYLNEGYANGNPKSLSENPPEYRLENAVFYINANNFARFEEIKKLLIPVADAFPAAKQIWEVQHLLDKLTNLGWVPDMKLK